MKIILDITKSLSQNASLYYEMAKKFREKAEGAKNAIENIKKQIEKEEEARKERKIILKKERAWYEKFHWFISNNFLIIGGRNAQQNEVVVAKYFTENDIFLHADIQGAPVVIIKNGLNADEKILEEAAQFAACYSSAWKKTVVVDVYAVSKEQVTKYEHGAYLPKGSFVILGRKKWFKNIELSMNIGVTKRGIECIPKKSGTDRFIKYVNIFPGNLEKGKIAKLLSKKFNMPAEEILQFLPNGKSAIKFS